MRQRGADDAERRLDVDVEQFVEIVFGALLETDLARMPALFTSTSMRPKRATVASTQDAAALRSFAS